MTTGHSLTSLSVIVPFHRNLEQLRRCLEGLRTRPPDCEVIVVADGARDDCRAIAASFGARVLVIDGPCGPAVARNRGADAVAGEVLVFVDADVVPNSGALDEIQQTLRANPDVAAVFGCYDESPPDPGFMSQYKNLSHSYIHQVSLSRAVTFWAGLGAIRARVFEAVGGFDERFRRPCVEDIELGYRVSNAGFRILLDPRVRGTHLKRWTLRSSVVSDVRDRGVPWTQLLLKFGRLDNDLNLKTSYRASVVLAYLLAGFAMSAIAFRLLWLPAALCAAGVFLLNRRYYAYFAERRGVWFAVRVVPVHLLHHWCNGLSYAAGAVLHYSAKFLGVRLPGTLPLTNWRRSMAPKAANVRAAAGA